MAALNSILNINEKIYSKRLVEAICARPILYESNTKSYKDADKMAAGWRAVAAELEVSGRCNFNIH